MKKYIVATIPLVMAMATTVSCSYIKANFSTSDPDKISTYTCENGSRLIVDFNTPEKAEITFHSNRHVTLDQQIMGSGFRYSNGSYSLTGKGTDAQWVASGRSSVRCRTTK